MRLTVFAFGVMFAGFLLAAIGVSCSQVPLPPAASASAKFAIVVKEHPELEQPQAAASGMIDSQLTATLRKEMDAVNLSIINGIQERAGLAKRISDVEDRLDKLESKAKSAAVKRCRCLVLTDGSDVCTALLRRYDEELGKIGWLVGDTDDCHIQEMDISTHPEVAKRFLPPSTKCPVFVVIENDEPKAIRIGALSPAALSSWVVPFQNAARLRAKTKGQVL